MCTWQISHVIHHIFLLCLILYCSICIQYNTLYNVKFSTYCVCVSEGTIAMCCSDI